ncbi:hypothetical protein BJ878DRAFT_537686 [Calycina marina]|uniref:Uncharacterized protein n=1 Tax=Calycina marina TaxID=1763456 RepID=A0A9P7ZCP0_9HELO|nr:hypothetical protein BJ878DRAFT_537686 [Calycina marina]
MDGDAIANEAPSSSIGETQPPLSTQPFKNDRVMRFLESNKIGELSITKDFIGDDIPEYAILSHTLGADTEKVTFRDLMDDTGMNKTGHKNIGFRGGQAGQGHFQYHCVHT